MPAIFRWRRRSNRSGSMNAVWNADLPPEEILQEGGGIVLREDDCGGSFGSASVEGFRSDGDAGRGDGPQGISILTRGYKNACYQISRGRFYRVRRIAFRRRAAGARHGAPLY